MTERVKYMPKKVRNPCKKQPHLECPYTVTFDGAGMKAEGHFKCCKILDQMKYMNKAFCAMEPGKTYNGTSITSNVRETALRLKKRYDELDTSGPLGYNKDDNESIP